MTVVDIYRDEEGRYSSFEMHGHADDAAVEGGDIICAAISMLAINTINSLEKLAKADIAYKAAEDGGDLRCCFKSPPDGKAALLVESMLLGLRSVQKQYGKRYLSIRVHGSRKGRRGAAPVIHLKEE